MTDPELPRKPDIFPLSEGQSIRTDPELPIKPDIFPLSEGQSIRTDPELLRKTIVFLCSGTVVRPGRLSPLHLGLFGLFSGHDTAPDTLKKEQNEQFLKHYSCVLAN
jgi:hypothetical protein